MCTKSGTAEPKSAIKNIKILDSEDTILEAQRTIEEITLRPLIIYRQNLIDEVLKTQSHALYCEIGVINARIKQIRTQLETIIS